MAIKKYNPKDGYGQGDVVDNGGYFYRAKTGITAGTAGLGNTNYWERIDPISDPVSDPIEEFIDRTISTSNTDGTVKEEKEYISSPEFDDRETTYETPEEALSNYLSFLNSLETQLEASRERGGAATAGGSLDEFGGGYFEEDELLAIDAAQDFYDNSVSSLSDYITNNNIPLYKDIDGQRYFLTTGADIFGSDADPRRS